MVWEKGGSRGIWKTACCNTKTWACRLWWNAQDLEKGVNYISFRLLFFFVNFYLFFMLLHNIWCCVFIVDWIYICLNQFIFLFICLKVITKDSNVVVVGIAIKCVTGIANGLKKKFHQYVPFIIPALFEKFKEKKQNIVTALREAVDAVYLTV